MLKAHLFWQVACSSYVADAALGLLSNLLMFDNLVCSKLSCQDIPDD